MKMSKQTNKKAFLLINDYAREVEEETTSFLAVYVALSIENEFYPNL